MQTVAGTSAAWARRNLAQIHWAWMLTWPVVGLVLALLIMGAARAAPALPVGGRVTAGTAMIGPSAGPGLTITQSSPRAIIDWAGFSIGQGGQVSFANGSGATLNRVTGAEVSSIDGRLSASGSVYLLNPNGVIIGKDGVVDVGGRFVASTLDVNNQQFLSGGDLDLTGDSDAAVINLGRIGSLGGDVALVAAKVDNEGSVEAPKGTVGLVAGYQVLLRDQAQDDGQFLVRLGGADTSAVNAGSIQAAAAELRAQGGNVYALAGNTDGIINATGVSAHDGRVFLVAHGGTVEASGTVRARGAGGVGGFIETSGDRVETGGATIDAGEGGTWLLDPTDLTIDYVLAGTINTTLGAGTDVTETTTGGSGGAGDITVNGVVSWSTGATFTLDAYHSILVNTGITSSGSGKLVLTTNDGGSGGTLSFGGSGNAKFTSASVIGASTHLTINAHDYTLLNTKAGLAGMSLAAGQYYALAEPITFTGTDTQAIVAPGTSSATPFRGTFEGLGNTITGLTITTSSAGESIGLFGNVDHGVVRDVVLNGVNLTNTGDNGRTGALVGFLTHSTVAGSRSTGTLVGGIVGGLVGSTTNSSVISRSYSNAQVTANSHGSVLVAGGLVGDNGAASTITQSFAGGTVSDGGNTVDVGGLVGFNSAGTISQSYATGSVTSTGTGSDAGGLAGNNDFDIEDSYATGAVSAVSGGFAGGLVGENDFNISTSYSTGAVSGAGTNGGMTAVDNSVINGAAVTDAYWDTTTSSQSSSASGTGQTTVQLQSGSLPTGFLSSVWGAKSTFYPYLGWLYPHGAIAISGVAYSDHGSTTLPGATITQSTDGTTGTTATSGADGAYRLLADGGQDTLVYVNGNATNANTYLHGFTSDESGADLYGDYLRLMSGVSSTSAMFAGLDLAAGINTGGDFLYTVAGGLVTNTNLDIQSTASGGLSIDSSLDSGTGTILVTGAGAVTQSQPLTAASLGLFGSGASYDLTNASNSIGTLAADTGAISFLNNTGLSIGSVAGTAGITSSGSVTLRAVGDLTIASGSKVTAGSGADAVLSATADFVNNQGADAVDASGGGRWIVYSSAPGSDTFGNLDSGQRAIWNSTYDTLGPGAVASGNRYVFAFQPILTFTATSFHKTFGTDASGSLAYTVSGLQGLAGAYLTDTAADAFSGTPTLSSSGTPSTANVVGGGYAITITQNTVATTNGYGLNGGSFVDGVLTVDPATLTLTALANTKTYDTNTSASATPTVSGLLGSDTVTGLAEAYDNKNAGTGKTLSVSAYTVNDGNGGANYAVSTVDNSTGVIDPAALTLTALTNTKTYDANTSASATPTVSGLLGSDTVTGLAEAYDNKNVGTGKTLSVSAYTVNDGASGGNYTVSTVDDSTGVINAAALTLTALTNTKTYDANTSAAATPSISGLQGSDTITGLQEAYDDKNTGTGKTLSVSAYTINDGAGGGNYTVSTVDNSTGVIDAAALTLTALANTKTYDTNTSAAATPSVSGIQGSDTVTGLAETYGNKDAGTGKTLSVSSGYTVNDGNGGANYTVSTVDNSTGVIDAAALTVSANDASKTYDATAFSGGNGVSYSGFVGGETTAVLGGSLSYGGSSQGAVNAGTYAITPGGLTSGNYAISFTSGTLTVDPAALTLTALANTKTYDTNTSASATPTVSGLQGSDTVTGLAEAYDNKNAGTGKTLSVSAYTINDGASGANYTVSTVDNSTGVIDAAALTLTALTNTKTYDANTSATATPTVSGLQGSDTVTGLAEAYDNKNAGTGKTLSVSSGYTVNDGNGGANYTVSTVDNSTGVINAAALTLTALANTKTYDANTTAAATPTVSGLQGSDTVTGLAEAYDNKNAGTGKTLSVSSGYTVNDGASGANYTVSTVDNSTGVINAAALTLTALANTKTYDANTTAAATPTASGLQGSDTVTGLQEAYDNKDAGTGKTLSVSAYTVNDGASGANYTVSTVDNSTGVIDPAALTLTALANTKTYDANTTAAATPTVSGLQGSDTVTGLQETYDNKNAGTGKALSVSSGYTVNDGAGGANYTVSTVDNSTGVVDPAALTLTALANTKTYDANTSATATPTVSGLQGSDTVTGLAEAYDNKDAGTGKTLSVSAYTVNDGASGANYTVSTVDNSTGVIDPAALTLTALTNTKTYDANTTAAATPTVSGLQGSDTVTGLAEAYDNKNAGTGKTLSVSSGYTVNDGAGGGNYTVSTVDNSTGVIDPAALTLTALANTKTYDTNTSASATPTVSGLLGSDTVTGLAEAYDNKNAGTGKTLSVSSGYTVNDGASGGNYTVSTVDNSTGVIDPAALTLTALTNTKTYDANTAAAATPTVSGLQGSDTVTGLAETYDNKNAGTGKTLSVSAYTVNDGAGGANYTVSTVDNSTGVIDPAALTLTALANTKTYDANTTAAATPTVSGLQGSDTVTSLAEAYDNKNAGTGKTLSVSAYTVNDGASGGNYTVSTVDNSTGVVDPAALTLTALANTKTYDANTSATATPTASGLQGSDTVTGLAETYDNKNAGTGKALSVSSGYTVNDGASGANYTVSTVDNSTGVIDAAALTLTALANTKTYDANTTATATPTVSGLQGSDTVTGLAEAYDNKNAGTGKTLSVSSGYTVNDGNGGANYTVSTVDNSTGVINAAALTLTALANTKTYDANTSATATPTVSGLQGSDTVTGLAETYDNKNAGTGKTLSVSSGYTVNDGAGGGNYTVSTVDNSTGVIDPAALTLTALTNTKTYDANTTAAATPTVSGLQGSDTVTGLAETYDNKNAGTGKTLSVSAYTVNDGAGGANYTVSTVDNSTGVIDAAALTLTALTNTKTYDANTTAAATPTVSGLQGSDTVTGLAEAYDNKNAGTGKTLSVSGYTINDGAGGANYTVSTVDNSTGVIDPAALTLTALANTKTYDANTTAAATPTVSGLQGSDTVTGLAEAYDDKNAGTGKTLSVSAYTINDGASGANYTVSTVDDSTGVIDPAALTLTALANTKTYDANTSAAATPTVSGLQGSDTVTGLAEAYDNKNAGTGKTLSVSSGYTVNDGASGGNYTVSTVDNATGVIDPAVLTITALADATSTKTYDGTTSSAAVPTVSGLMGSDTVTGLAETYDNKNAGTGKTLSVSSGYTVNDGNGGANYTVSTVDNPTGVIDPAALTITALTNTKTYDANTSAAATPSISGLQGSDTVTGLAEAYDDKNAGTGKTLSVSAYTINDGASGGQLHRLHRRQLHRRHRSGRADPHSPGQHQDLRRQHLGERDAYGLRPAGVGHGYGSSGGLRQQERRNRQDPLRQRLHGQRRRRRGQLHRLHRRQRHRRHRSGGPDHHRPRRRDLDQDLRWHDLGQRRPDRLGPAGLGHGHRPCRGLRQQERRNRQDPLRQRLHRQRRRRRRQLHGLHRRQLHRRDRPGGADRLAHRPGAQDL